MPSAKNYVRRALCPPIIYKITNLINSKIYIGKDYHNNPEYLGSGVVIRRAIKKYGKNNFKKETLETCTKENVDEKERYWIKLFDATNREIGYNRSPGGIVTVYGKDHPMYGAHLAEIAKKRLSVALYGENHPNYGKHLSEKTRMLISKANTGKHQSEETKKKLSLLNLGEKNPKFGKPLSEETKRKMSESSPRLMLGRHHSEETKRKMSAAQKGKHCGEQNPMFGKCWTKEKRLEKSEAVKKWWAERKAKKEILNVLQN